MYFSFENRGYEILLMGYLITFKWIKSYFHANFNMFKEFIFTYAKL